MNKVIGKYATEIADIECPECSTENRINTKGISPPFWSCKDCGYSPDWEDLYSEDTEVYPCNWCGRDISDDNSTVVHCRSCMRESQKRQRMKRNQECPNCGEMLTGDDLRKIKKTRGEAKKKLANIEQKNGEGEKE